VAVKKVRREMGFGHKEVVNVAAAIEHPQANNGFTLQPSTSFFHAAYAWHMHDTFFVAKPFRLMFDRVPGLF
jgi:hypothetical protein